MAIFSEGEEKGVGDILISVWLLVCCLISTSLNPLVFLYNYRRPNTVQRVVYRTLSILDFITCLVLPVVVVNNALKATDCQDRFPAERTRSILYCSREATTPDKLLSAITWTCVYLPPILTAVLTSARLYHIKFPLKDPLHKNVLFLLFLVASIQICFITGTIVDPSSYQHEGSNLTTSRIIWWGPQQAAMNYDIFRAGGPRPQVLSSFSLFLLPFLAQLVGLVATLLTVSQVLTTSRDEAAQQALRNSARITKKILMTNMGSMVTNMVYQVYLGMIIQVSIGNGRPDQGPFRFIAWTIITSSSLSPCLISAVNPLIFIIMTPNFIKNIKRWKNSRAKSRNSISIATSQL